MPTPVLERTLTTRTLSDADVEAIATAVVRLLHDRPPRRPQAVSRVDRDRLGRLLPAIIGPRGSDWFTIAELVEDEVSIRVVLTSMHLSKVDVGQLFSRAVGVPVDGHVLERGDLELHRRLWRVVVTM